MNRFNLEASLLQTPKNGTGDTYIGYVKLADLIAAQNQIGKDIYSVNVRGCLFTGKSPDRKNRVFKGISETLIGISNGKISPNTFLNSNQGCLLMCESIKGDLKNYEVTISQLYHGIGNGQQTISVASFINNKYPISPDVKILIKIMVGYSSEECYSACESNNNSTKISLKNIISNNWEPISKQLIKLGYILHYKQDKIIPKSDNLINIWERNFYNFLNAYHCETPWISGDKTISNGFDVSQVSVKSLLDVFMIKIKIDNWFSTNINNYDVSLFDVSRTGYIGNILVTAYKKYYDKSMSTDDFIKLCFDDVIYPTIISQNKRVNSSFFTTESNCKFILNDIQNKMEISKLRQMTKLSHNHFDYEKVS